MWNGTGTLSGAGLRVGIAMSRFNQDICEGLLSACANELVKLGVARSDIVITTVPGALELPVLLKTMALSGRFDALVAIGAVVRGETYHFEVVSNESARGITDAQLQTGVPIANGVLTCETDEQAEVRMQPKGSDCAQAAVEMANLQKALIQ